VPTLGGNRSFMAVPRRKLGGLVTIGGLPDIGHPEVVKATQGIMRRIHQAGRKMLSGAAGVSDMLLEGAQRILET
jgi:hypothetical protein